MKTVGKVIGEFEVEQDLRMHPYASMYLGSAGLSGYGVDNPGSDVDKFLVYGTDGLVGYRTGAEVLADIGGLPTSTSLLVFDGSTANGICTFKDADEISVESTLTYNSGLLTIGADDNAASYVTKLAHSDGAGGMLQVKAGSATGGQANQAGGDLRLAGGQSTGSGAGGSVTLFTSPAGDAGSATGTNSYSNSWVFGVDGSFTTEGGIELGHASDTTIARASAGVVSIEGSNIVTSANLDAQLTDLHAAGVDGSANQLLTDDGDGTVTSEAGLTFSVGSLNLASATSGKPQIHISSSNTTKDTQPKLVLSKGATGEDGENIGSIDFIGNNDDDASVLHAQILGEISDATDGEDGGKLTLGVASHDGNLRPGIVIEDGDLDTEVDVIIANGAASTTTIAGTLTMGSTAAMGNTGLLTVGAQTGITAAANLVTVGTIGTGVWQGTAVASAYLDADTAHLTTTQDFTGNKTFSGLSAINNRVYSYPGTTDGDHVSGDIMYYDSGTVTTVAGFIYYFNGSGSWTISNNDSAADATGMLAVALGTNPDVDGMLLRGMVTLYDVHGTEDHGAKLHLHSVNGTATTTVTTTSGSFVRIIGYNLHNTNDAVYFNPDNTFIEVA